MLRSMLREMIKLLCVMFSISALAGTSGKPASVENYLIELGLGPTWGSGNKTQTFYLQPGIEKTYAAGKTKNPFLDIELFVGRQIPLDINFIEQSLVAQLGIAFSVAGNTKLNGDIWEYADPDFNNYNYTYKINHSYVAIKTRIVNYSNYFVDPYVAASFGLGFNRSYDFTITPKISSEVAAPAFTKNTKTTFSYALGIGIQKSLSTKLQAAIGYEFADWGNMSLSRANGQSLNQGLSLKHFYAQQMQVSMFYII